MNLVLLALQVGGVLQRELRSHLGAKQSLKRRMLTMVPISRSAPDALLCLKVGGTVCSSTTIAVTWYSLCKEQLTCNHDCIARTGLTLRL